jgi:hypothetical protein
MQIYEVRISHAAYQDMVELRKFLDAMLSEEGADNNHAIYRYRRRS